MYILNYSLASFALRMDTYTLEWLHEILNSTSTMKEVLQSITEDDYIITHAIDALESFLASIEVDEYNVNEGDATDPN